MGTKSTAKAPAKAKITADIAKDLRKVYLTIFDSFAMDTSEVALEVGDNARYARELTGVLQQYKFIDLVEDGEGSEAWQVTTPGTYDQHERDEAETAIDKFLAEHLGTKAPTKKAAAKSSNPDSVSAEGSPCLCGCGEATGKKSNYRPGHDARHAGQVGRAIAANYDVAGFDRRDLLATLPSDLLRSKAEAIAEKAIQKEAAKDARAAKAKEGKVVEGTLTVGKNERMGRRNPDGTFEYMDDNGDWKAASKTAASTFQEG